MATLKATSISATLTIAGTGADTLNFTGASTNDARGISFNGRGALTADQNDGWLRINTSNEFTNGVYTPGAIRADGGFAVDNAAVIDGNGALVGAALASAQAAGGGSGSGGGVYVSNVMGFSQTRDAYYDRSIDGTIESALVLQGSPNITRYQGFGGSRGTCATDNGIYIGVYNEGAPYYGATTDFNFSGTPNIFGITKNMMVSADGALGKNKKDEILHDGLDTTRPVKVMRYNQRNFYALYSNGNLYSYGDYNAAGQLGVGSTESHYRPFKKILTNVKDFHISNEGWHTTQQNYYMHALTNDGKLFVWGHNNAHRGAPAPVGNTSITTPTQMTIPGNGQLKFVATSGLGTWVADTTGKVWFCGRGYYTQGEQGIGVNSTATYSSWTPLATGTGNELPSTYNMVKIQAHVRYSNNEWRPSAAMMTSDGTIYFTGQSPTANAGVKNNSIPTALAGAGSGYSDFYIGNNYDIQYSSNGYAHGLAIKGTPGVPGTPGPVYAFGSHFAQAGSVSNTPNTTGFMLIPELPNDCIKLAPTGNGNHRENVFVLTQSGQMWYAGLASFMPGGAANGGTFATPAFIRIDNLSSQGWDGKIVEVWCGGGAPTDVGGNGMPSVFAMTDTGSIYVFGDPDYHGAITGSEGVKNTNAVVGGVYGDNSTGTGMILNWHKVDLYT